MITKYYIDHAVYKAEDDMGNTYELKVDYWNNKFKLNKNNIELSNFAKNILNRKHRVNLWPR